MNAPKISRRTLERLSLYRRLLSDRFAEENPFIYSHSLATLVNVTPSQVRRDIMVTGCAGNPSKGYRVSDLVMAISRLVDSDGPEPVILIGVGKLGSALIDYVRTRRPHLRIVAAFDAKPMKVDRDVLGVHCHEMSELEAIISENGVHSAILTVPAQAAQDVANLLVKAGILGILNFAPVPLHVPTHVFVESIDLTSSLDKVTFFARQEVERTDLPASEDPEN